MGLFVYFLFSASLGVVLGQKVGLIMICISVGLIIYGFINARILKVVHLPIYLKNLPDFWSGKKIVFFADAHLGQINAEKYFRKILTKIRIYNPELILCGGDLFDSVAVDVKKLATMLGEKENSQQGVYYVTGNHECFGDSKIFTEPLREAGVNVLKNDVVNIKDLQIIGIDYQSTETKDAYKKVMTTLKIQPEFTKSFDEACPFRAPRSESSKCGFALIWAHISQGQFMALQVYNKIDF